MDSNKQLDELFQQLKKVDRSAAARQDSLEKLRVRVQKKKKFHLAPAFISFAMALIVAILFLTYTTKDSILLEGQSGIHSQSVINEQTLQKVLEQEFNGPNEQFIRMKTYPASLLEEQVGAFASGASDTIYLQEFLRNTYGSFFTASGYENFVPYAFFYHLGEEFSTYEIRLGSVEIIQTSPEPTHYTLQFDVDFINSRGISQKFPLIGLAVFAEEGKLEELQFEDKEGLSVIILENL